MRPQPATCPGLAHTASTWTANEDAGRTAVAILAAAVADARGVEGEPSLAALTATRATASDLIPAGLCRECVLDLVVHLAGSAAQMIPASNRAHAAAQMRRHMLALGRN